jgi:DNA-binding NtrC family response regulator
LNSRGKDILPLARHFLKTLCLKYKLPVPSLSKKSEDLLLAHSWTGNTRELIHELERTLVMSEKGKSLEILPARVSSVVHQSELNHEDWLNPSFSFPKDGFDLEKEVVRLIQLGIQQSNGNISEAARLLGVPRDYIRYRLQKKGA